MQIRNIAIIAHVDHGKTTLTDSIMKQTGQGLEGVSMDSNALELERGITIYAKNTSIFYPSPSSGRPVTKINIVDTPGHADFGSEVERVLRSIDSVILVVDAQEGPMPQTRFVLRKSLQLGLNPIVVINKIDKSAARPEAVHEMVLELFFELGANERQLNFTTVYAIGRDGVAKMKLSDTATDLNPLLDVIIKEVTPSVPNPSSPLRMQSFNLAYDNFLGRMAVCRIYEGTAKANVPAFVKHPTGETRSGKTTKLFTYEGLIRKEVTEAQTGDIVMVAGFPDIYIGETIVDKEDQPALPAIAIDEPTISLNFLVNDSPFGGHDGKFVTGRQIRERLERELEVNVGLKVDFEGDPSIGLGTSASYTVYGRGELHIAILLENMRREGFEMQVSQPQVIIKEIDGIKTEPYEEVILDVKTAISGGIISTLSERKGIVTQIKEDEGQSRIVMEIPTRGLLGYRGQFVVDTRGEGILSSHFIGFRPHVGEIKRQHFGSMISMATGKVLAFALDNLQQRGTLYIEPSMEVYEGQVIGSVTKGDDLYVNPTKAKQLTNMRSSGTDEAVYLAPAWKLSIERAMEIISEDEYIEITPKIVRLRKKFLTKTARDKAGRKN